MVGIQTIIHEVCLYNLVLVFLSIWSLCTPASISGFVTQLYEKCYVFMDFLDITSMDWVNFLQGCIYCYLWTGWENTACSHADHTSMDKLHYYEPDKPPNQAVDSLFMGVLIKDLCFLLLCSKCQTWWLEDLCMKNGGWKNWRF